VGNMQQVYPSATWCVSHSHSKYKTTRHVIRFHLEIVQMRYVVVEKWRFVKSIKRIKWTD